MHALQLIRFVLSLEETNTADPAEQGKQSGPVSNAWKPPSGTLAGGGAALGTSAAGSSGPFSR